MPIILRTIRKAKWYRNEGVSWLPGGQIQADALSDLSTNENKLSVWEISENRADLEKVITALAATKHHVSNVDYAILEKSFLTQISIIFEKHDGGTPYEAVNSLHCHLLELTAHKIYEVARGISEWGERKRIPQDQVLDLLKDAVKSRQIQMEKLKEPIKSELSEIL